MTASYGRNAVPPRLRARDSPVAIVVVLLKRTRTAGGMRGAGDVRLYVSVAVAGNTFFVCHPMNRYLSGVEFQFGGRSPEVILSD